MKVLFVCTSNVGRSQMAEAFFNAAAGSEAQSAGIKVGDAAGQRIVDRPLAEPVIRLMGELGFDLSQNTRTQVTPEILDGFDKIIVMSERDLIPEYLQENTQITYWDVADPSGKDDDFFRATIAELKRKVENLRIQSRF